MAREDDLSVNINVGVELDKASFKEAKKELEFLIELQKELGVEGVSKVRVGGYSTGNSPDKVSRNKAAKQFEKMGGDWTGVDIADKAQAELAKQFNQASKELAKLFNIDFIPDAAAALGQIDFSMPDPEKIFNTSASAKDYNDKLQKATEDFFMDALGEVTISPAMFLAAAEKVMKGNPELYMPRGLENAKALSWMQTGGPISPTSVFKGRQALEANPEQIARFDKVAEENIAKYGGEKMAAAFTYAIGKDLDEIVIGAWEKASKEVASNKDVQKILADDPTFSISGIAASDAFANLEIYFMERFVENVKEGEIGKGYQSGTFASNLQGIKSASRGDTLINLPDDPMNALPKDKIINWLDTMIEDGIMHPLQQVMENPAILGKAFISQSESAIKSGFTRLVKESSGETTLSKKAQEEKRYNDQVLADIKAQVEAHKELNDLKAKSPEAVATATGGGAGNPDIEMLRKYLTEQKALVEQSGKTFMAGLDTEFNSQIDEKLTELGMVIQDGSGKLVEIFKFLQLPGDTQAMYKGSAFPAGNARTPADLAKRAQLLGIPKEEIGVPGDSEANFLQYREKISKLVSILDLLSELGISLTGSSFQAAEAANIKKAIEYINSRSKDMGLDPLATPDLKNVFDPAALAKTLAPASSELTKIFDSPEAKAGISGALGNLIKNIAQQFPEFIAKYSDQFRMSESGSTFEFKAAGGPAQAHYALTDAAASLIVKDFIEEFGGMAATMLVPVAKDLNTKVQAAAGGSGGGKGPNVPMAAGDKPEDDPYANRAAQSIQQLLLTGQKYESAVKGLTKAEIVKVEQRLAILQKSSEQAELLAKLAELEKKRSDLLVEAAQLSAQSSSFGRSRIALGDASRQGPLTQGDAAAAKRYQQQTIEATKLGTAIAELTIEGQKNERQVIETVKSQSRQNVVSEQLTQNMRKEIDANIANAQAGKTASTQIKAQMQEQVNAQKAVQKQTQSLMNTWITSRYALYDIGNFYTSVAQNLIRVSRQIFDTTQSYRNFESSFTSVERAMQLSSVAAVDLRNQFILLSEEFPVTFEEISRIATLGAQMGIAADGVVQFTKTVAEFSSITGISADTVAQKFGRIAELADVDTTDFEKLGSAVAFAGINAVATEIEILSLSESIAAVSNQSGITAPEIIGLATALASLGIPAEQARGVFTRVFADLDRVANTGGESLANFASVAGISAEEFASSWGTEGKSNDVFTALLRGIGASENLTATFDKLNIVETREINTLTRLAKNLNVLELALSDTNASFDAGVFLGDSFEKTADNLDSKITVFKNNLDSLAASFSAGIAEPLKNILDIGSNFLKFLKGASQSFLFLNAALPLAGLVAAGAVLAGFAGIAAKVTAQVYAFRVAMVNAANDPMAVAGFSRQLKSLLGLGSGMIEMRDQVSGINEKGLVEPVDYSKIIGGEKAHAKELLQKRNIYLSLGDAARQSMGEEAAKSLNAVQLSRKEADAVNDLLKAKRLQIETLEKSENPADIAAAATMRQAYSTGYVVAVEGEIRVLNERERAEHRNRIATSNMDAALKKKTLAHIDSAQAVNLESKAASAGIGAVGSALSRFLGVVTIVTTAITLIDMLYNAFVNLNKVDLAASGGGIESLREAIKKDTEEFKKTNEAITTVQVAYKEVSSSADKAAIAINKLTGTQSLAEQSMDNTTESARQQTLAIGENTKVWLANALAKNEELQKIDFAGTKETLDSLGMDFDSVLADMTAAANGAEINPLQNITSEIASVQSEYEQMLTFLATSGDALIQLDPRRYEQEAEKTRELGERLEKLRQAQTALSGIQPVLEGAFREMSNMDIINNLLGITTNSILELSDALSEAETTGEGMEGVLSRVQEAAIEVAGITSAGDLLKIRTTSSVKALLEVVKTMYEAAKAADSLRGVTITDLRQDRAMAARGTSQAARDAVKALDLQIQNFGGSSSEAGKQVNALKEAMTSIESILAGSGSGSRGPSSGSKTLEEKVRTLTDYANDLRTVLQSAFDIRYQRQVGLDAISSSWLNLTSAAKDAERAVKSANDEINQSVADKAVLQYQLSVAERYNDEKRAAVIRAKLAKLDEQIIDQQQQLAEANENNNKTLVGNSKAAIDNRAKVRDLVTQYNSYLVALANGGASSAELSQQAAILEQEFLNQGEALGYSRDELDDYTSAFAGDFTTVINNLPTNITLEVKTDPALRAIEEFVTKASAELAKVGVASVPTGTYTPPAPAPAPAPAPPAPAPAPAPSASTQTPLQKAESTLTELQKDRATIVRAGRSTTIIDAQIKRAKSEVDKLKGTVTGGSGSMRFQAAGGYISGPGTGTSDSIPAMLSNGEYVIKASSVSKYGLEFMNALNQQRVGFQPVSQSSNSMFGGGSSVVYLSPEDRALLRSVVDRPVALYTENTKIAQSANAGNVLLAQRGSN